MSTLPDLLRRKRSEPIVWIPEKPKLPAPPPQPVIRAPNPAAQRCKELGGTYKIENTSKGRRGICILPNGKVCDEWELYFGKCGIHYLENNTTNVSTPLPLSKKQKR